MHSEPSKRATLVLKQSTEPPLTMAASQHGTLLVRTSTNFSDNRVRGSCKQSLNWFIKQGGANEAAKNRRYGFARGPCDGIRNFLKCAATYMNSGPSSLRELEPLPWTRRGIGKPARPEDWETALGCALAPQKLPNRCP